MTQGGVLSNLPPCLRRSEALASRRQVVGRSARFIFALSRCYLSAKRAGWGACASTGKPSSWGAAEGGVSKDAFRSPCFETRSLGALLSMGGEEEGSIRGRLGLKG
jgi:hypothetical protein